MIQYEPATRGMIGHQRADDQSNTQLMQRLANGETAALDVLYERFGGVVFGLVLRIVRDRPAAEELVQEVFVRAWQHAGRYQAERGGLRAWLLVIGHHLALNELRRRQHRPVIASADADPAQADQLAQQPASGPDPAEAAWVSLRRASLRQALDQLPPPQRTVLELYAIGYSQSEIAAHLQEPLGTIKARMRRGLLRLRELLPAAALDGEDRSWSEA